MLGKNHRMNGLLFLSALILFLACNSALGQEVETVPEETETATTETTPPPEPPVVTQQSTPIIVYTAPPPQAAPVAQPQADPNPLANLRQFPRRLRPIDGQEPPPGYVEATRRNKKLIIAGAVVFGVTYIGCLSLSDNNALIAIPLAGPMIAGFNYEDDPEFPDADQVYAYRMFGTLGTIAQATGVALFIAGMVSKKMHWLRQDVAGISYLVAPTLLGQHDPGLGISGTF